MLLATAAFADDFDLAPYARVIATDTQNTFLLMWPRETDDAPYTTRDGLERSGWKTPRQGVHALTFDFAPLLNRAPTIARLESDWERMPAGEVAVRILDYCGGKVLRQGVWNLLTEPLIIANPKPGACVQLLVRDAGPASLTELRLYAAPVDAEPVIENLQVEDLAQDGVRLSWQGDEATRFVQIHYIAGESDTRDEGNRLATGPARDFWEGPRPADAGMLAAVTPLGEDGSAGQTRFVAIPAREEPTLERNGAIEGFYSTPWSWTERRRMILHLARIGLRIYMYAPKEDPLHRDNWRIPYSDEVMARFIALRELGELLGVDVYYAIAPGKSMILDDPDERATLMAKLTPFVDGGFRHFMIMFDDIENDIGVPVDGVLGAQHADLVDWTKDQLTDLAGEPVQIFVNPLAKRPEHIRDWPGAEDYIVAMGETDPDVILFWGAPTDTRTLNADFFSTAFELQGRRPAFWDNQYAIDGGDGFTGRLQLAPMCKRSADLYDGITAYLTNIMFLGAADRLIMPSYSAYMHDPAVYDTDIMPPLAAALEARNTADAALLEFLMFCSYGNNDMWMVGASFPHNVPLDELVVAFWEAVLTDDLSQIRPAVAALLDYAGQMATAQNDMHHSGLDPALVDDMWVPFDRLTYEGFALLHLLRWYGTALSGASDQSLMAVCDDYLWDALLTRYQSSLFRVQGLRYHLGERPVPELSFAAPTIRDVEAQPVAGEVWTYDATDVTTSVYGLPGAMVAKGKITWTPPHAGIYRGLVIAADEQGWAWRELNLVVAQPPADDDDDTADDDDDAVDDDDNDAADDDDNDDNDDSGSCGC